MTAESTKNRGTPTSRCAPGRDSKPRHRDTVSRERLEQRVHGARPIGRGHHERGLVACPDGATCLPAEHPETAWCCWARPRCAARGSRADRSSPAISPAIAAAPGSSAASRAASALLATATRGTPRADAAPATARIARATAHANRPCVTSPSSTRVGQQVLRDAQLDLAANREIGSGTSGRACAHRAFGRVLHRHDRVIRLPALDGAKRPRRSSRTDTASTNSPKCRATAAWLNVPAGPR